ncbi:MAG: penicillin-binding transpeptidase domain-containing protein [Pseudomonadota bacterium]
MSENREKWIRFRLVLVFLLLTFSLCIASVRAYKLQISKQTELNRLAERQRIHKVELRPPRGVIYDRRYQELAVSVEVDSVYTHPWQIKDHERTAEGLRNVFGLDAHKALQTVKNPAPFVWIERGISPAKRRQMESLGLKGIHFIKENKRFYPQREIGGHFLGFVGIDGNGLEGLERSYDSYLTGGTEYFFAERDALGREILSSGVMPLEFRRGDDLIVTIDLTIQYILEKELQKAVEQARARGGIGIVMNPKTGEILGLAIHPSFNPNNFGASFPKLWRNRIITDCFEPGSTFKIFLAAAAIEEKVVSPEEIIYCENGSYRLGKRIIHDLHKYGNLSFAEVVKYSSNIGAVKVCERLDAPEFYNSIQKFGFGDKTGIDLPGESPGLVRPYQTWREIDKSTISFGQGVSGTPLQLINALCAIANGGYLMRPFLVKAIVNEKGELVKKNHPRVIRKVISEQTAQVVTEMMIAVVSEDGTGRNAQMAGFEVAGKTGTAQKVDPITGLYSNSKFIGSFMGFVPARDPVIAVLIVIDEPQGRGFGGTVAAPAFKAAAEQILTYLNVFPQPKCMSPVVALGNPGSKETPGDDLPDNLDNASCLKGFPDLTGLSIRKVLQMVKDYNLTVHVEGSGRAISQKPSPGTPLSDISECWVMFNPRT